jgi:DNA-binding MarR family transcriptional regulator
MDLVAKRATPATDAVDAHVARWAAQVPEMDTGVEGALTRMQLTIRQLRKVDAEFHADRDFTLEDSSTLHALMVHPYPVEATPAQLADSCHVTRAAMTSRLDRLLDGGYVTREVDPLDRRRTLVRPTGKGRETWNAYLHAGKIREKQLLSALTPSQLDQLNILLRKIVLSFEP